MKISESEAHRELVIEQFSKQSVPFTKVPGHHDAISILIELSNVSNADEVLDVACGPGIVASEFAKRARHVTGVDVTKSMLEVAAQRQTDQGISNIRWIEGDALNLPFEDSSFSLVITRYSFHHLLNPMKAIQEMMRVCKPDGRVVIADVALPESKSLAYDSLEKLRDPSHTHALTEIEFDSLLNGSGLKKCTYTEYSVEIALEAQMKASFPAQGDEEIVRQLVTGDIGIDAIGIKARRFNDEVFYTVPVRVYTGIR